MRKERGYSNYNGTKGGEQAVSPHVNHPVVIQIRAYAKAHKMNMSKVTQLAYKKFVETEPWFSCDLLTKEEMMELVTEEELREYIKNRKG